MKLKCSACDHIKESQPTPDGDEVCPVCWGDEFDEIEVRNNVELWENGVVFLKYSCCGSTNINRHISTCINGE